jgi:putative hemolysin
MPPVAIEIIIVLMLILLNGVFAMSEIAVVSARQVRLQQRAQGGDQGAQAALDLAINPNRFLSTVQVGITLIGIFAGAFGGATVAQTLAAFLRELPFIERSATAISLVIVVTAITFLSVVLGELVPKRIALQAPERIAALIARPMNVLSTLATPIVRLLSIATDAVLTLLRIPTSQTDSVTQEEIRGMVEQGALSGVIAEEEQDMVERVFNLGDTPLEVLMTPRPEIAWLEIRASETEIGAIIDRSNHSLFPVCDNDLDHVVGIVSAKHLLSACMGKEPFDLAAAMQKPLILPATMRALKGLERFKQTGAHMALLIDEYGGIEGLVTLIDVLEALVGDIPTLDEMIEPIIVEREDGSYFVDGLIPIEEFKKTFGIRSLPGEGEFLTLGGFVVFMLGRLPIAGDHFGWGGFRIEVADMDGRRVDKTLIKRSAEIHNLESDNQDQPEKNR